MDNKWKFTDRDINELMEATGMSVNEIDAWIKQMRFMRVFARQLYLKDQTDLAPRGKAYTVAGSIGNASVDFFDRFIEFKKLSANSNLRTVDYMEFRTFVVTKKSIFLMHFRSMVEVKKLAMYMEHELHACNAWVDHGYCMGRVLYTIRNAGQANAEAQEEHIKIGPMPPNLAQELEDYVCKEVESAPSQAKKARLLPTDEEIADDVNETEDDDEDEDEEEEDGVSVGCCCCCCSYCGYVAGRHNAYLMCAGAHHHHPDAAAGEGAVAAGREEAEEQARRLQAKEHHPHGAEQGKGGGAAGGGGGDHASARHPRPARGGLPRHRRGLLRPAGAHCGRLPPVPSGGALNPKNKRKKKIGIKASTLNTNTQHE